MVDDCKMDHADSHPNKPPPVMGKMVVVRPPVPRAADFSEPPQSVKDAIRDFKAPQGCVLCEVPSRNLKRSIIYDWGVRYEENQRTVDRKELAELSVGKPVVPQRFACLANEACRQRNASGAFFYSISSASTTGATTHLQASHGITTRRKIKSREASKAASGSTGDGLFQDLSERFMVLDYVKSHIIRGMIPFDFMEDQERRCFYREMRSSMKMGQLGSKRLKSTVCEIYTATVCYFVRLMLETVREALLPIVYISIDVCKSQISDERFIGLRVYYLDKDMLLHSHLLAVKPFRPAPSTGENIGEIAVKWAIQVLQQFGLEEKDVAGVVSNTGSQFGSGVSRTFEWDSCILHLLDRATVDGTGLSFAKKDSKNLQCRKLVEDMKTVIETLNKLEISEIQLDGATGKAIGVQGCTSETPLAHAAPQRPANLTKMTELLLQTWELIESTFERAGGKSFPLAGKKSELEEVYSILVEVKAIIDHCLSIDNPVGPDTIHKLAALMASVLDPEKSLNMHFMPLNRGKSEDDKPHVEKRAAEELTTIGSKTRKAFHDALAKLVVHPRYGPTSNSHSHLLDLTWALTPLTRGLKHLDVLRSSQIGSKGKFLKSTSSISNKIWLRVTLLTKKAIEEQRRRDCTSGTENINIKEEPGAPPAKRTKVAEGSREKRGNATSGLELFDDVDDDDGATSGSAFRSEAEEAENAVAQWRRAKIPGEFKNAKSGADACEFWRKCGHRICPSLKPVAQAILGVPASAAHLSRDLSMAGQLVCREGCALDTAYAEMLLFLHGNFKYIPDDIPRLTAKQVQAAIPYRLTDPAKLREVAGLDTTQGEDMLDRSLYACADEYVEDQDVDGKGQDEMDEGGEAGEGRKGRGESAPRLETRRKEETGKKGKGKGNPST